MWVGAFGFVALFAQDPSPAQAPSQTPETTSTEAAPSTETAPTSTETASTEAAPSTETAPVSTASTETAPTETATTSTASTETTPTAPTETASTETAPTEAPTSTTAPLLLWSLHGSIEGYYQWNAHQPANGLTAFRGFDNRHNTLTLSNVVVDGEASVGDATAHVALQTGSTGATYFLAEPTLPGSSSVNSSDAALWRNVQQAWLAYRLPLLNGLTLQGGLFLSPIGPEGILVKDNWNFSRSNLFFGLPFYHTGARAALSISPEITATAALYNGWNSVVDNNQAKSVSLQLQYSVVDTVTASVLYFGGHERADGGPEGFAWRHLVDAHATWTALSWLALQVHGDAGAEPNAFGTSSWLAGALAARAHRGVFAAALRLDGFVEHVPAGAAAIFWPAPWVSSTTLTLEARPVDGVSLRVEGRADFAGAPMYFAATDTVDASAREQFTTTIGAVAWF